MLSKLRLKFVILNMVIVAIVLTVAFTSICLFSRQQERTAVQVALDASLSIVGDSQDMHDRMAPEYVEGIGDKSQVNPGSVEAGTASNGDGQAPKDEGAQAQKDGRSDDGEKDFQPGSSDDLDAGLRTESESTEAFDNEVAQEIAPPEIGGRRTEPSLQQNIPVATYRVNADGSLSTIASSTTATITADVLDEASRLLAACGDGFGEFDSLGLFYEKRTIGAVSYVAFADSAEASNWKSLALTLLGVGILMLGIFFVISLFFSKWALRPVEKAWETQTRFVADASHDLKTPLTIILANTSIMRKHPDATVGEMGQWLESTECEAHEMQALVGDMLVLAQLDEAAGHRHGSSTHDAQKSTVNLSKIAKAEVLQFESVAFESGLSLSDSIEDGIEMTGDESKLKRLMTTLIDNACKYAGVRGSIEIKLSRSADGKHAVFSVFNTGSFIPEDDLPHVFDRFYRADKARSMDVSIGKDNSGGQRDKKRAGASASTAHKSHGLGLAIAHGIAEEHQGELTVTSNEAQGTRFTVRLPLKDSQH